METKTRIEYEMLTDEELIALHEESDDNLGPLYELRWRWQHCMESLPIDHLMIMVATLSSRAKKEMVKRAKENGYNIPLEGLALMMQDGDAEAKERLISDYYPNIKNIIRRMNSSGLFFPGFTLDDLVSEGTLGLYKAVRDFKIERRTLFRVFARHVIKKHINSLILHSSNNKLRSLNESLSYHIPIGSTDSDMTYEHLMRNDRFLPEDVVGKHDLFYKLWDEYSILEKKVLWYYAKNYTYLEIGELVFPGTEKTAKQKVKAVDNTVQRFKNKRIAYENNFC